MIDAHIHIKTTGNYFPQGNTWFINTTDSGQWGILIRLAGANPGIVPFFGIHPWFIQTRKDEDIRLLEEIISRNQSFHVGEIGLDRIRAKRDPVQYNFGKQIEVFKTQLALAVKYGRAVTIHCVRAWDTLFPVLEEISHNRRFPFKGILHYFSASREIMNRLLLETDLEADREAFSVLEAHY